MRARQHAPHRFEPAHAGHRDIEDDDIGIVFARDPISVFPARGFRDHPDVRGFLEQAAIAGPDHGVVVHQHDADRRSIHATAATANSRLPALSPGIGSTAITLKPRSDSAISSK